MLLKLVVAGVLVTVVLLVVTQIILPLLTNKKLFPAFRKYTEVDKVIENLYQKHEEFDQAKYANDLANELKSKIEKLNKESK